ITKDFVGLGRGWEFEKIIDGVKTWFVISAPHAGDEIDGKKYNPDTKPGFPTKAKIYIATFLNDDVHVDKPVTVHAWMNGRAPKVNQLIGQPEVRAIFGRRRQSAFVQVP